MPTHPAVIRQQARQASGEQVNIAAPVYYTQNASMFGTSAWGPLRKSLTIHVEGAAGQNAGVNQIATQDADTKATCDDAVKEGFLTKIGALI